jgi:hypothetical protein
MIHPYTGYHVSMKLTNASPVIGGLREGEASFALAD